MTVPPLRRVFAPIALGLITVSGTAAGLLAPETAASASRTVAAACDAAGPAGWALLVLIQITVAASGILPGSLFGILAGALYGPALGFALAAIGTLLGAGLSFAIGRWWRRRWSREKSRPFTGRLHRIDAMIVRDGWRAVCLLRLSPIMPFALTSWALSLSRVSISAYGFGTLAALPALFVYVMIGSVSRNGVTDLARTMLLGLGAAATLVLAIRLRRSLARQLGEPDLIAEAVS